MYFDGWMKHNPMKFFSFFKRTPTVNTEPTLFTPSAKSINLSDDVMNRLSAGEVADAWAMLEACLPTTDQPHLLALAVHICIVRGKIDEAIIWSERAQQVGPKNLDVLRSQARLAQYLGQFEIEYQARLSRIIQLGMPPVPELTAALRALIDWGEIRGRIPKRDVERLLALFTTNEPLSKTSEINAFSEQLYRLSDHMDHAIKIWRIHNPHQQVEQLKWASGAFLAQHHPSRFQCTFHPKDSLIKIGNFNNATIWTGYSNNPSLRDLGLIAQGYQTTRQRTKTEDTSSQLIMHNAKTCLLQASVSILRVHEPSLLIGSSPNYYHFLIEHLGRLAVMHELNVSTKGLLCWVNRELIPFQAELLELAGIEISQIRMLPLHGNTVHFDTLCAPFPPTKGGHRTSASVATWARDVLITRARKTIEFTTNRQPSRKRLYLSRKNTARRRIHNEATEIWPWLSQNGFEYVETETLSISEQLLLFSDAEWIVGGSGAAMSNMIFMPAGGKVVLAINQHFPAEAQQQFFPPLAQACGHNISVIPCAPVVINGNRAMDADIHLNQLDLIKTLSTLGLSDI